MHRLNWWVMESSTSVCSAVSLCECHACALWHPWSQHCSSTQQEACKLKKPYNSQLNLYYCSRTTRWWTKIWSTQRLHNYLVWSQTLPFPISFFTSVRLKYKHALVRTCEATSIVQLGHMYSGLQLHTIIHQPHIHTALLSQVPYNAIIAHGSIPALATLKGRPRPFAQTLLPPFFTFFSHDHRGRIWDQTIIRHEWSNQV